MNSADHGQALRGCEVQHLPDLGPIDSVLVDVGFAGDDRSSASTSIMTRSLPSAPELERPLRPRYQVSRPAGGGHTPRA